MESTLINILLGFVIAMFFLMAYTILSTDPNSNSEEAKKRNKLLGVCFMLSLVCGGGIWYLNWHKVADPLIGKEKISMQPDREITILTSRTKFPLLQRLVEIFNKRYRGQYYARLLDPMESRDGAWAILKAAGLGQRTEIPAVKPVIFSPSDSIWLVMLAYKEDNESPKSQQDQAKTPERLKEPLIYLDNDPQNSGGQILNEAFCRRCIETPMAVITPNLNYSKVLNIFSADRPWTKLAKLNSDQKGLTHFFTMANPSSANSGARTVFMMLKEFHDIKMPEKKITEVVGTPEFYNYLSNIMKSYQRYPKQTKPEKDYANKSRDLFDEYIHHQPPTIDSLISYESFIGEETEDTSFKGRYFANVELRRTEVNDHPFAIIKNSSWVSPQQTEGAQVFLQFAQKAVLDDSSEVTDAADISQFRAYLSRYHFRRADVPYNKPQPSMTLRVDDYYAQNNAIVLWQGIFKKIQEGVPESQ